MPESTRERPALFRALGKNNPPERIEIGRDAYRLEEVFKHDSWAATALYSGESGQVVCKFNRTQSIMGLPVGWLGRWLASRESFAMQRLSDVEGIPNDSGVVQAEGKTHRNAVAHEFLPGHPLGHQEKVNDNFFPALLSYLHQVHRQKMAYVDLHKRENILVGEQGEPYLIDFQICFRNVAMRKYTLPTTKLLLRLLQYADLYHFTKHVKRLRPDQIEPLGLSKYAKRPWWINAHRTIAVPFRQMRRKLLSLIKVRGKSGRSATETFAEHAFRCDEEQNHNKAA